MCRILIKYTAVFIATVGVLLGLLCLAAKIPREAIKKHVLESTEYLCESEQFEDVIEGVDGSRIDHYADAVLLNIAWSYDVRYPLRSVMLSAYYYSPYHPETENLLISVSDGRDPNQQYLRYWHGSIAIVRPLLTMMSVRWIYIFNGTVLFLLFVILMVMLIRLGEPILVLGVFLGLTMTAWWFVPLSLEYT